MYTIPGFRLVRGIGRDNDGSFYVVNSFKSRVVKFDKDWNPVQISSIDCCPLFSEPNGILVDSESEYIFVCSHKKKHICVLDRNLNLRYTLRLSFNPIDIEKYDGKYFVTTESAIFIIDDVNFQKKSFTEQKLETMVDKHGKYLPFKESCELRGICTGNGLLYVTEKDISGRLLCLEFHGGQLRYINAIQKCAPNAIAHFNGLVYYSQGVYEGEFCIMKVTGKKSLKDTKCFDVK